MVKTSTVFSFEVTLSQLIFSRFVVIAFLWISLVPPTAWPTVNGHLALADDGHAGPLSLPCPTDELDVGVWAAIARSGHAHVPMYSMLGSQKLAVCATVLNPSSSLAVQDFPNSVNIIVPNITHPDIIPFKERAYITWLVACGRSFPYSCSATLYIYVLGPLLTLPCYLCRS